MKVKENRVWAWLSTARQHFREDLDIERLENGIGSGLPDVRGCLKGQDFWIELKADPRPARDTTPIKVSLRDEQHEWAERYLRAGGTQHWLLVQIGAGHTAGRYLIHASRFPLLKEPVLEAKLDELSFIPPRTSAAFVVVGIAANLNPTKEG